MSIKTIEFVGGPANGKILAVPSEATSWYCETLDVKQVLIRDPHAKVSYTRHVYEPTDPLSPNVFAHVRSFKVTP